MLEVMMIAKVHIYLQVSRVVDATFVSVFVLEHEQVFLFN